MEGKFVSADVYVTKHPVHLSLHHYSSGTKMSRARHLGYMSSDIVVFMFSLNDAMSFDDIEEDFTADAQYLPSLPSSLYSVSFFFLRPLKICKYDERQRINILSRGLQRGFAKQPTVAG